MPTLAECKSLRDYMKNSKDGESAANSFEWLCECEKLMVTMMAVKQSKKNSYIIVQPAVLWMHSWFCTWWVLRIVQSNWKCECFCQITNSDPYTSPTQIFRRFILIEKVCDELSNSVHLHKLFGVVLNISNHLNTMGPDQKRRAGAFSINSLLKLNQAKALIIRQPFSTTLSSLYKGAMKKHYLILMILFSLSSVWAIFVEWLAPWVGLEKMDATHPLLSRQCRASLNNLTQWLAPRVVGEKMDATHALLSCQCRTSSVIE